MPAQYRDLPIAILGQSCKKEDLMVQRSTAATTPTGNDGVSGPSLSDLSAAIDSLTQAAQTLTTAAAQIMQILQTLTSGTGTGQPGPNLPRAQQINTWGDDPFSEAVPTENPPLAAPMSVDVPANANPLLQTHILGRQSSSGQFPSGTPDFRFWMVTEALARGINFWTPLLPSATRWSTVNPMQVTLDAGEDLNAFYSR